MLSGRIFEAQIPPTPPLRVDNLRKERIALLLIIAAPGSSHRYRGAPAPARGGIPCFNRAHARASPVTCPCSGCRTCRPSSDERLARAVRVVIDMICFSPCAHAEATVRACAGRTPLIFAPLCTTVAIASQVLIYGPGRSVRPAVAKNKVTCDRIFALSRRGWFTFNATVGPATPTAPALRS